MHYREPNGQVWTLTEESRFGVGARRPGDPPPEASSALLVFENSQDQKRFVSAGTDWRERGNARDMFLESLPSQAEKVSLADATVLDEHSRSPGLSGAVRSQLQDLVARLRKGVGARDHGELRSGDVTLVEVLGTQSCALGQELLDGKSGDHTDRRAGVDAWNVGVRLLETRTRIRKEVFGE